MYLQLVIHGQLAILYRYWGIMSTSPVPGRLFPAECSSHSANSHHDRLNLTARKHDTLSEIIRYVNCWRRSCQAPYACKYLRPFRNARFVLKVNLHFSVTLSFSVTLQHIILLLSLINTQLSKVHATFMLEKIRRGSSDITKPSDWWRHWIVCLRPSLRR